MMSDQAFEELRAEFNEALPGLIAGLPDRTNLMVPISKAIDSKQGYTIHDLVDYVSDELGIKTRMIYSRSRTQPVCMARHLVFYIANEIRNDQTLYRIGRMMERDHTTVISGIRSAQNWLDHSGSYAASYRKVMARLGPLPQLI